MSPGPRLLVLGVGNPHRGDDGLGPYAARHLSDLLQGHARADLRILSVDGEATTLLERLSQADHVYLIDACRSKAAPGALFRFDARAGALPTAHFGLSSHGPGLAEALELARALDLMPARCIVYAIEGESYAPGAALTRAARLGAKRAALRIREEIEDDGTLVKSGASGGQRRS